MNISEINSDTKLSFTILVADDDPDDRFLLGLAFEELQGVGELHFVEDGEQLINCLCRQEGQLSRRCSVTTPPQPGGHGVWLRPKASIGKLRKKTFQNIMHMAD